MLNGPKSIKFEENNLYSGRHLLVSNRRLLRRGPLPHVHRLLRDSGHRLGLRRKEALLQREGHDRKVSKHLFPSLLVRRFAATHLGKSMLFPGMEAISSFKLCQCLCHEVFEMCHYTKV